MPFACFRCKPSTTGVGCQTRIIFWGLTNAPRLTRRGEQLAEEVHFQLDRLFHAVVERRGDLGHDHAILRVAGVTGPEVEVEHDVLGVVASAQVLFRRELQRVHLALVERHRGRGGLGLPAVRVVADLRGVEALLLADTILYQQSSSRRVLC